MYLKLIIKRPRFVTFGANLTQIWEPNRTSIWTTLFMILSVYPRSPWSNSYDPPLEDGTMPSESLRKLEVEANAAFDQYREMYFEGGVSSVYLWDLNHGFAGVILIKKAGDGSQKIKGCWDSIHVIEVQVGFSLSHKLSFTKKKSFIPI